MKSLENENGRTNANKIAEFFYNFLPMDDYPTEDAISELAEEIKNLPEDNGTSHGLYTYMSSAYDQMNDYKDIYTPDAFDIQESISNMEAENKETYKYHGKRTEQGVLYVDIARFLLRMADMGLLNDFDDNTHYNLIGDALEKAPANITYVLSSATENMLKNNLGIDEDKGIDI